ncbi:hypothetical protein K501DRAFT_329187 [Backusella circina FSU 941]|nr:hypothetical protein K501DRAFT_329187 [Backusella circina FSU 941]
MTNLPPEILHDIFIKVSLQQRVKCMLVCRHWFNVLHNRSLLYDVEIDCVHRLKSFIFEMQRSPMRLLQVEIFTISVSFNKTFDKRMFLNFLPNLRVFKFKNSVFSASEEDPFSESFQHLVPDTKLEEIKDGGMCEFTRQLTMTGTCINLRRLSLTFSLYFRNPRRNLFPYLKNMPVLKKLTLKHCDIGIEDCEILHSNLPSVEEFHLKYINLVVGPLPNNITPATSLTSYYLLFEEVADIIEYPNWYIYMAKKYTNLTSLVCIDHVLRYAEIPQTTIIYRDGLLPLYKNIGKRLHYFDAKNVPEGVDVFNQLDSFGCQIGLCCLEHNDIRPIFTQLAQSNQAKYVKQLDFDFTSITSPSMLQNMTSLTSINIDMNSDGPHWSINLVEYMNAFPPTLTRFSACCTDLKISEVPSRLYNLRKFFIECHALSKELAQIVSTCFPKLDDLFLRGRITENMTIDLPANHFKRLCIETYFENEPNGFSLETTSDSQVKCYLGQVLPDNPGRSPLKYVTAQELQEHVILRIICASAKHQYFYTKNSSYTY